MLLKCRKYIARGLGRAIMDYGKNTTLIKQAKLSILQTILLHSLPSLLFLSTFLFFSLSFFLFLSLFFSFLLSLPLSLCLGHFTKSVQPGHFLVSKLSNKVQRRFLVVCFVSGVVVFVYYFFFFSFCLLWGVKTIYYFMIREKEYKNAVFFQYYAGEDWNQYYQN